jgi:glycosyltransferase involved in cell wall biosynthesis
MLLAKGHEVAVIAPASSISPSKKKIDGLDVYGLPSISLWLYPGLRLPLPFAQRSRIDIIIKRFKPDVIHIQDHFTICKAVVKLNRKLKIPIIATNHFLPENITVLFGGLLKQRIEKFLWKDFSRVFNQVKVVTTPSQTGVNIIRNRLHAEPVAISSGINLEKFASDRNTLLIRKKYLVPDKPILLYVGRLDPEKNIEEILQSVAMALKKIDFCFVVVGKGIRRDALEQLAVKLGIAEEVIFTGFVPDADLPFLYSLSKCFIIASTAELLSLATLQAMASGLPIIAVNAGALSELVRHEVNGYLYESGDFTAIVQYIVNVIGDDRYYESMSKRSIEYAHEHDIKRTVEAFENLYKVSAGSQAAFNGQD